MSSSTLLDVLQQATAGKQEELSPDASHKKDDPVSRIDLVECPMCHCNLQQPRLLPCGHAFCQGCLESWLTNGPNNYGKVLCPKDLREFPLPKNRVAGFPRFEPKLTTKIPAPPPIERRERALSDDTCDVCDKTRDVKVNSQCPAYGGLNQEEVHVRLLQCANRLRNAYSTTSDSPVPTSLLEEQARKLKAEIHYSSELVLKRVTALIKEYAEGIFEEIDNTYKEYEKEVESKCTQRHHLQKIIRSSDMILSSLLQEQDMCLPLAILEDIERKSAEITQCVKQQELPPHPKLKLQSPEKADLEKAIRKPLINCIGHIIKTVEELGTWDLKSARESHDDLTEIRYIAERKPSDAGIDSPSISAALASEECKDEKEEVRAKFYIAESIPEEDEKDDSAKHDEEEVEEIVDSDDDWHVLDQAGIHKGGFKEPQAVAYSPVSRHIYVADTRNKRISIFDEDGHFVSLLGKGGKKSHQFKSPWGLAITSSGELLVTEREEHCVKLVQHDHNHVYSWGGYGSVPGCFMFPCGIAFSEKTGRVFVCDESNHRVQIYSMKGKYIKTFGSRGERPGKFNMPTGVAACGDHVAISDFGNDRVEIYGTNGVHRLSLKDPLLRRPWGLAMREAGKELIVCSESGILVFRVGAVSFHFVKRVKCAPSDGRPLWIALFPPRHALVTKAGHHSVYKVII